MSLLPAATRPLSVDLGDCDAVVTVALGVGTAPVGVPASSDSASSPSPWNLIKSSMHWSILETMIPAAPKENPFQTKTHCLINILHEAC